MLEDLLEVFTNYQAILAIGDYQSGSRGKKEDWEGSIKFGDILPKWNYECSPVF